MAGQSHGSRRRDIISSNASIKQRQWPASRVRLYTLKVYPQWHTSFNKALPPNPSNPIKNSAPWWLGIQLYEPMAGEAWHSYLNYDIRQDIRPSISAAFIFMYLESTLNFQVIFVDLKTPFSSECFWVCDGSLSSRGCGRASKADIQMTTWKELSPSSILSCNYYPCAQRWL